MKLWAANLMPTVLLIKTSQSDAPHQLAAMPSTLCLVISFCFFVFLSCPTTKKPLLFHLVSSCDSVRRHAGRPVVVHRPVALHERRRCSLCTQRVHVSSEQRTLTTTHNNGKVALEHANPHFAYCTLLVRVIAGTVQLLLLRRRHAAAR